MKETRTYLVVISVGVFLTVIGSSAYFFYQTFSNTGQDAVAAMNPVEREWLARLETIAAETGEEDVYRLIGPPSEQIFGIAKWKRFADSGLSELRIYFIEGHPINIRWLKLGGFIYEKRLDSR